MTGTQIKKAKFLIIFYVGSLFLLFSCGFASSQSRQSGDIAEDLPEHVASVRRSLEGTASSIRTGNAEFVAKNIELKVLIAQALGVSSELIRGFPSWANKEHFDVRIKVVSPQAIARMDSVKRRALIKAVLDERFSLKIHEQLELGKIYFLQNTEVPIDRRQHFHPAQDGEESFLSLSPGNINARAMPISVLCSELMKEFHELVVDQTGLQGKYDFEAQWAVNANQADDGSPESRNVEEVLRSDLGLRLLRGPGQRKFWVVDQIRKPEDD